MRPNMNMMKQMQQKLAKIQEDLETETVEATAGGAVTVVMTGHQKLVSIKIAPDAIDPDDASMLEDLITVAVNDAVEKSHELVTKRMGAVTGGLRIPGLT